MFCHASDVEIETIISRIKNNDIRLQPDFQRGEVWTQNKKKKLIDSILRGWKIPPIHLVQSLNEIDEVLDGQQRLVAIRDFINNDFEIDGSIEPYDNDIFKLNKLKYSDLSVEIQRRIKKYSITMIRLTEYKPEEPAELFYRLNQPVTLTSAEQRNAYIGKTRSQVKMLVDLFCDLGASKDNIGFSNSRLAYDEIISKYCYCVEFKSLKRKITAGDISDRYRKDEPFSIETIIVVENVLRKFINASKIIHERNYYYPRLSKATLYSWFVFIKSHINNCDEDISEILFKFEASRDYLKGKIEDNILETYSDFCKSLLNKYTFFEVLLNVYNQRSSMGSTDALAIIYRDIILNIFDIMIFDPSNLLLQDFNNLFNEKKNINIVLEYINNEYDWGENY